MQRIAFVPGAVVSPAAITIPVPCPDIDLVVAAIITRLPAGVAVPNHLAADIQASAPPANHAHNLVTQGVGGAPANAIGLNAGLNALEDAAAAALHTVPGAGATGVQNQVHAYGAGVPTVHGANTGGNPSVAAVPTRLTSRTISLNVNTALGDILTLDYIEVGARVPVS